MEFYGFVDLIRLSQGEYCRYWRLVALGYVPEDMGQHTRLLLG